MQPGYSQTLPGDQSVVISFDRGDSLGEASYTLTPGAFHFTNSADQGWDLTSRSFQVTLDNSQGKNDFNYVANGEAGDVPAGQTRDLNGKQPIVVDFDRGDGQPSIKQLDDGVYRIAINSQTNTWDLFPAASESSLAQSQAVASAPAPAAP